MENKEFEILSPAGEMESLKSAILYGADAVYMGGKSFGMRTSSKNFSEEELSRAVKIAHDNGVKIYLTCNNVLSNDDIDELKKFVKFASDCGVDAIIVSDIGAMRLVLKYAPRVDVHISTQAGVMNYETANFLYELGAKRVILARETSLEEIKVIREKTNQNLEIECFVHGSMCMSFSGRCLISNYLTGKDANKGACTQPCRWQYSLMEKTRKGEYFPIIEQEEGTYFFNSKDLCMIEHIDKLAQIGVKSFKIEGRAKSSYYTGVVTYAYKKALKSYLENKENWRLDPKIKEELYKVSHREYSTGFYFGEEPGQVYNTGGYQREYEVVGICTGYRDKTLELKQKNKFYKGDILEVLDPKIGSFEIKAEDLFDEFKNSLDSAPHPGQKLFIPCNKEITKGSFIRKKINK